MQHISILVTCHFLRALSQCLRRVEILPGKNLQVCENKPGEHLTHVAATNAAKFFLAKISHHTVVRFVKRTHTPALRGLKHLFVRHFGRVYGLHQVLSIIKKYGSTSFLRIAQVLKWPPIHKV